VYFPTGNQALYRYSKRHVHIDYEPGRSVNVVSGYGLDTGRSRFGPRQRQRIFPVASVSRLAQRPTQPPAQWVPGVLSPGVKSGRGVTLTTHPHLVPRSRMSRSYTFSPPSAFVSCSGTALAFRQIVSSANDKNLLVTYLTG
jgi:hypothetical protein